CLAITRQSRADGRARAELLRLSLHDALPISRPSGGARLGRALSERSTRPDAGPVPPSWRCGQNWLAHRREVLEAPWSVIARTRFPARRLPERQGMSLQFCIFIPV